MRKLNVLLVISILILFIAGILPLFVKRNANIVEVLVILSSILMAIGMIIPEILRGINKRKAIKNGIAAFGVIQNIKETGRYINKQPQINVELLITKENGEKYTANLIQVFSYTDTTALQVGVTLPLKYLAENPSVIAQAQNPNTEEFQKVYNEIMIKKGLTSEEGLEIAKNGVTGNAIISSLNPTGKIENGNPELEIKMLVTKENGEKIEVSTVKIILKNLVSYVQPGQMVEVVYMPNNPEKLIIKLPALI